MTVCFEEVVSLQARILTDVVGGLEVFHRPTQTWHPVHPVKDAYVVNIGDMMGKQTLAS